MSFLGSGLSFISHVAVLKERCTGALGVVEVVASTGWGADTLLYLCRSLVRSKLDCGCVVYGAAGASCVGPSVRFAIGDFDGERELSEPLLYILCVFKPTNHLSIYVEWNLSCNTFLNKGLTLEVLRFPSAF